MSTTVSSCAQSNDSSSGRYLSPQFQAMVSSSGTGQTSARSPQTEYAHNAEYVSAEWLASVLKRPSTGLTLNGSSSSDSIGHNLPLKVFDIRPLQYFMTSRIKGSSHLQVPNLILKRLRRGPVRLSSLMSDTICRQELENHAQCNTITIVLYEESPMVHLLVRNFAELGFQSKILKGTFAHFESKFPELCERLADQLPECARGSGALTSGDLMLPPASATALSSDGSPLNFSNSASEASIREPLCNLRITCSQPATPARIFSPELTAFPMLDISQPDSPLAPSDQTVSRETPQQFPLGRELKDKTQWRQPIEQNGSKTVMLISQYTANSSLPVSSGVLSTKSRSVDLLQDDNKLAVGCEETKNLSTSLNNSSTCLKHCGGSSGRKGSSRRNPHFSSSKRAGNLTQILPHLFLGDQVDSRDVESLRKNNIRAIVNVTPDLPNMFERRSHEDDLFECTCEQSKASEDDRAQMKGDSEVLGESAAEQEDVRRELERELKGEIKYLKVPIDDQYSTDISSYFPLAISFIDEAIESGDSVLVHCLAGVSRSVTIMIAYLIASKKMRLGDALEHVRSRRPNISPNFNFMGQLLEFEKQLFSSNGSSPVSLSKPTSLSSHSSPLAISPTTTPTTCGTLEAFRAKVSPKGSVPERKNAVKSEADLVDDQQHVSTVLVTTPNGTEHNEHLSQLHTGRRLHPSCHGGAQLDSNSNFTYFPSTSECPEPGPEPDPAPVFELGAFGQQYYEEEEEDVFFSDEKMHIHRSFSEARVTAPNKKSSSVALMLSKGVDVNSKILEGKSNLSSAAQKSFKPQRQMSEAACVLVEQEQNKGLSSWDDTTDLVHLSPNATAVNKKFNLDNPRDTLDSEMDLDNE